MSRIGKKPIQVPKGVTVTVKDKEKSIVAKGPKGESSMSYDADMTVALEESAVTVTRPTDTRRHRALHGLTRALIANQLKGVSEGFSVKLEIHGTGYSAAVKGNQLTLNIGFCHPVEIDIAKGLEVKVEKGKPIKMLVSGIDKQAVGQLAANIRKVRPPEPYKLKGIRYANELLIKKEGKAFGKK